MKGSDIYTEADTVKELKEMIKDAIICHFDKDNLPGVVRLHFVKTKEEIIKDLFSCPF